MRSGAVALALGNAAARCSACAPVEEGIRGIEGGAGRGAGGVLLGGSEGLVMGKAWGTGRAEASSSPNWILQQWADTHCGGLYSYDLSEVLRAANLARY